MSAQTLPSDFVYAEDARPVSTSHANVSVVIAGIYTSIRHASTVRLPLC